MECCKMCGNALKPGAVRCIKCGYSKTPAGDRKIEEKPTPADIGTTPEAVETSKVDSHQETPQKNVITREQMVADLGVWGGVLIFLGLIHILLAGLLDPVWGVTIIIVGAISLVYRNKNMYIILGLTLITVGLLNMSTGSGWRVFGIIQIILGIKEITKYGKVIDYSPETIETPSVVPT